MPIGFMRYRVELISPTSTPDGAGGFVSGGTVQATCWADVRQANVYEREAAGRAEMPITSIITIRFESSAGVIAGWRVRWADARGSIREARVQAVREEDHRMRFLTLDVMEGGPL
jgi:SPP1 family predicted phage head-tail adaptor